MFSLCHCGCGKVVREGRGYIHGHNAVMKKGTHIHSISNPLYPLCLCGCGRHVTKATNKYLSGHSSKGRIQSLEERLKRSKSMTGRTISEETRAKCRLINKGRRQTAETIAKIRNSLKGKFVGSNNCFYGKTHKPETIVRMSLAHMGKHYTMSEEHKRKIGLANKGRLCPWAAENARKAGWKIAEKKRQLWSNPEFKARVISKVRMAVSQRPNKPEAKLLAIINEVCPNQYKYTGNGLMVVNGLCPDFTNCDGQKKVVEMFGDYWHRNENVQDRIDKFAEFGFDCLVIWENEVNHSVRYNVKERVKSFNGKTVREI